MSKERRKVVRSVDCFGGTKGKVEVFPIELCSGRRVHGERSRGERSHGARCPTAQRRGQTTTSAIEKW